MKIRLFKYLFITIALAYILCQAYLIFATNLSLEVWLSAAIINSCICLLAFKSIYGKNQQSKQIKKKTKIWMIILPALTLLLIQAMMIAVEKLWLNPTTEPTHHTMDSVYLYWILWVPFVEEVFFRRLYGDWIKSKVGLIAGSYFSVLLFAMVHSVAPWHSPHLLFLSIPLGALLVGVFCELILVYTQSLTAAILFHISCNLSAIIFIYTESSWLLWLSTLYH